MIDVSNCPFEVPDERELCCLYLHMHAFSATYMVYLYYFNIKKHPSLLHTSYSGSKLASVMISEPLQMSLY
jgi:hypothetical protein